MGEDPKTDDVESTDEGAPSSRPSSGLVASLATLEGLGAVWDGFRAGGAVHCPRDSSPLALAVDSAAASYRFVCVRCGASSPWFESGAGGLRMRTPTPTLNPGSLGDD